MAITFGESSSVETQEGKEPDNKGTCPAELVRPAELNRQLKYREILFSTVDV